MIDNLIDIDNLGYKDPTDSDIETYSPGNNTGAFRYRVHKGKLILYISSSLMSKFVYLTDIIDYCPKQIFETVICQNFKFPTTESMKKGSYFETGAIGSGAGGLITNDLPKQKNGKPYIDQVRIDEQILKFKHLYPKKGMIITDKNTQVRAKKRWSNVQYLDVIVYLTGEADIITPYNEKGIIHDAIIVDLKLTKDLTSTFGKYGWGSIGTNYNTVDMTQSTTYHLLFGLPFAYWIFDYKAKSRENLFFFVNHNTKHSNAKLREKAKQRLYDFKDTVNKTINEIVFNFKNGWKPNPEAARCEKCTVSTCKYKNQIIKTI